MTTNRKQPWTAEPVDEWTEPTDPYRDGFDVVVRSVVGHVSLNGEGELTPHEAAFLLIARWDMRGHFEFPMRDGRTMSVSVDYPEDEQR